MVLYLFLFLFFFFLEQDMGFIKTENKATLYHFGQQYVSNNCVI